jgi:crotonobetainyl-CoA:carnitine CoA-transferase CaiB-like acyl-CoA transferase
MPLGPPRDLHSGPHHVRDGGHRADLVGDDGDVNAGRFARRAWADLAADPALLARVQPPEEPVPLPSSLAVGELAVDSVAVASLALNAVQAQRAGGAVTPVRVSPARVAASYRSERLFRLDGEPTAAWAPLSGFWATADGWVRTHANYPHHAARLRQLLGLAADADPAAFAAALADRSAVELEAAALQRGAIVAAVRDAATWREHPHARALTDRPLIDSGLVGDAAPRRWPAVPGLPLAGIRVLDLTRVIAGPVATRDLAAADADVLRVDSPRLPEIAAQHLDTGQGKRSTLLDLDAAGDRQRLAELLDGADVVVTGYRPGALGRFGLDPDALAERRPGLVVGQVSAWDTVGPWAGRRGFDSIVQATIGIAVAESPDGGTPGALPAQALDHSAGHLLAAGIALALARQRSDGGSHRVSVALARVGQELLATPGSTPAEGTGDLPTVTVRTDAGQTITCAPPVLAFAGAPEAYRSMHSWGSDEPRWLDA